MFHLLGIKQASSNLALIDVLVEFFVELGATIHSGSSPYVIETKDGDFFSFQEYRSGSTTRAIDVRFGTGQTDGELDLMSTPNRNYYQFTDASDALLDIECWVNESQHGQIVLFMIKNVYNGYLLLGRFKNEIDKEKRAFLFTGTYGSLSPIPSISSTLGYQYGRGRLHLSEGFTPTQQYLQYTTSRSSNSIYNNEQHLIFPTNDPSHTYDVLTTPGAGLPMAALSIHTRDPGGNIFYIGTIPSIFHGGTRLPDGARFTKEGRTFQVCKSDDSHMTSSHFYVEVPSAG